ncbi:phospholipase D-like domain-containing protein [Halobellus rufus]|uniref:phospholipase D-like domain-containing protein n=1 Tax=Halobellus rufus TaxID=1448860 RepID=UPI0006796975|nr:phospholipase D-like domain-containing protein [Halobellus rufus]
MSPRLRQGRLDPEATRPPSDRAVRAFLLAVVVALAVVPSAGVVSADAGTQGVGTDAGVQDSSNDGPRIVAVFPDPVAEGDAGEHVVVDAAGAPNLTLSDGETTVSVPPDDVVALSATPNATRELVDVPVAEAGLYLSNAGETLELRRDGAVVDRLEYERANEGERLNASTGEWTPRGLTPRPVVATGPATATAFVLPDAPGVPTETLERADERVLLAGYTFTSVRATDSLVDAADRGVRVRVLLEGGPVGGMTTAQRERLDRLVAGGVDVRVIGGPHARYVFHHPKYAVADDAALVMTENWKPSGTGGRSSRGWGVRVDSEATADELAAVFAHDADGIDAVPWRRYRANATFVEESAASGSFDAEFEPRAVDVEGVRVLTAPGNAGCAVRGSIAGAERRIDVLTPRLDPDGAYFAALVDAAERGVRVRVLLSNAWYDRDANRRVVERVDALRERGVPIEARIAEPSGRFGKVHAKGAVIDRETVLVAVSTGTRTRRRRTGRSCSHWWGRSRRRTTGRRSRPTGRRRPETGDRPHPTRTGRHGRRWRSARCRASRSRGRCSGGR